jgi:putative ABC transport system substrate-binding protein
MRRRDFLSLVGTAAAWPVTARAQQSRRVGVLMGLPATDSVAQAYLAAFLQALRKLGWIEGQNLHLDIRWNAGGVALGQTYAAQLVGVHSEVILVSTTKNLQVIREATSTVPVVFTQVSDPVAQGFAASLTKPGGNLTGFSAYEFSTGGKWLDLLKEMAPGVTRAAVLFNPDESPQAKFFMRAVETAASSHGVQAISVQLVAAADIEPAITSLRTSRTVV